MPYCCFLRLTTLVLYQSSLRWFEACSCKPTSRDLPSSLARPRGALRIETSASVKIYPTIKEGVLGLPKISPSVRNLTLTPSQRERWTKSRIVEEKSRTEGKDRILTVGGKYGSFRCQRKSGFSNILRKKSQIGHYEPSEVHPSPSSSGRREQSLDRPIFASASSWLTL